MMKSNSTKRQEIEIQSIIENKKAMPPYFEPIKLC